MVTSAKAIRLSNLFLFAMGLCVFTFDRRTQQFVRKFRHILYVSTTLFIYLCFTALVMMNVDRISIKQYTGQNSLNCMALKLYNSLQIFMFPLLILLSFIDGRSQAIYFNELIRYDRNFGIDYSVKTWVKRFWMECLAWHVYYNCFVNPLDSYVFDLSTAELQLYYWAFSLSAIGAGTFISYVTLALRMYFDRVESLKTHLRENVAALDDRLAVAVGMLNDLCWLRNRFQDAFGLASQVLMQMMMILSLFAIYFMLTLISQSSTVFLGLFDYFIFIFPMQLRIVMLVRQMNCFQTEVNVTYICMTFNYRLL